MAPNEHAVDAPQQPQLQSINRVVELPVVKSALALATDQYEKLKSYNALIGNGLSKAEQIVQYGVDTAKPVVHKLEKQLSFADNIACQGLDKLEEKVPAIKKSPDELKTVGWEKIEEIKGYGNSKVEDLKAYGYERVNQALHSPYANAVLKSVDSAMDMTEHAVDHYLPASGDEPGDDEGLGDKNVVQRMGSLSEKMRLRMYKQAGAQLQALQKRSEEAIDRMKRSVELIAHARTIESGRQAIATGAESVQTRAKWLWDELNKEQEEGEQPQTIDQQLLNMARKATHEVVNRYNQLGDVQHLLSESAQQSLVASQSYAKDVYQQLTNAKSLKDVSDVALKQFSSAIEVMQQALNKAITPVPSQDENA